ncbi:F-box protein FBW2 [Magnolia sinica]|uniref:F-box protein FBW2 n=1 Tax=Magnolia sinica TaxID=86752 RepID=UPI00265A5ACB|nr:F-box protein FBW2 [Magnolia sinica]
MAGVGEFRCWEDLIPDALALIFSHLSLQEILTVVPRVCKSWAIAVSGPYCWQDIDIEEWSLQRKPEHLDQMLRMLVTRSCSSVRRLSVSGLPNDAVFSFIADRARSLQTLQLPRSEISDSIVEQVAGKLSNITFLDLSYCGKIGARALEAFGKHCKSLVGLKRIMHPLEVADKVCQDDEALAIATTMPKLKHLEMAYLLLTNRGVLEILSGCRELEFLDVRGCWDVELDEFVKEKYAGLKVLGPHIVDCYEMNNWDDCSDYSDSSSFVSWEFMDDDAGDYDGESFDGIWDDEQGLDGLEVRFYEGFNDSVAGFGWPSSP